MHISKGSRVSPHYILYSNNNNYDQYHVYVTLEDCGKIGGVSVEQRYKIADDLYLPRFSAVYFFMCIPHAVMFEC